MLTIINVFEYIRKSKSYYSYLWKYTTKKTQLVGVGYTMK